MPLSQGVVSITLLALPDKPIQRKVTALRSKCEPVMGGWKSADSLVQIITDIRRAREKWTHLASLFLSTGMY